MFLLAAGVLVLSGCGAATLDNGGSSETQSEEKAASELTVGVSISTLNNPFLFPCKRINQLAEENDTDVRFVDAQDDTAKQSNDIDDLIQQGVDVLLINPLILLLSSQLLKPLIMPTSQLLPSTVVAMEERFDDCCLNNEEGGKMAAEFILEQLGKTQKW